MQQLFDEYIFHLANLYAEILEEVGTVSRVMSYQTTVRRNETPLKCVVRLDDRVELLKKNYPQFAYITQFVFQTEEMFEKHKFNTTLFLEMFPGYGDKEAAIKSFLMMGISLILKEKESEFLLNYLGKNDFRELCWSECFASIYKNHQFLRPKAMAAFCSFLDKKDMLRAACGKTVISIFDKSKTSVQDIIKLLQKIYEKSSPNYSYI